jgi:hypothetical protein
MQNFPLRQNQIALHPKSKQHHSPSLRLEKNQSLIETTNTLNWFDDYTSNISFFNSAKSTSFNGKNVTICCALIGATIFFYIGQLLQLQTYVHEKHCERDNS